MLIEFNKIIFCLLFIIIFGTLSFSAGSVGTLLDFNEHLYLRTVNKKTIRYKKLSYHRGTARCIVSVEILPITHASAQTTSTTSPEQIEVMKLEVYSWPVCNKHVHSTMTRPSRFHCPIGVINKPTTDELWISPVYRRLAVAKFSKSTM